MSTNRHFAGDDVGTAIRVESTDELSRGHPMGESANRPEIT
jgi:hypothetical protein